MQTAEMKAKENQLNDVLGRRDESLRKHSVLVFTVVSVAALIVGALATVNRSFFPLGMQNLFLIGKGEGIPLIALTSVVFVLLLITVYITFTVKYQLPIKRLVAEIRRLEQEQLNEVRKKRPELVSYLWDEILWVANNAGRILIHNERRARLVEAYRDEARHELIKEDPEAEQPVKANLTVVQTNIAAAKHLVDLEIIEQQHEVKWQQSAVVFTVVYAILIIAAILTVPRLSQTFCTVEAAGSWPCELNSPVPILGIPLPVLIWAATGSLAAILYRLYTKRTSFRFRREFRWLIARPFIGIIMGAIAYLSVIAGLVLIGNPPIEEGKTTGRNEVYWIIAFLAGFSDKFYHGIIDLLVVRLGRDTDPENDEARGGQALEVEPEAMSGSR